MSVDIGPAGRRRPVGADQQSPPHAVRSSHRDDVAGEGALVGSVACGACGGRISLHDFVLVGGRRMTRVADCPQCGETTIIALA